jgi:hypothetical protein
MLSVIQAKQLLGYEPHVSIDEGVQRTVKVRFYNTAYAKCKILLINDTRSGGRKLGPKNMQRGCRPVKTNRYQVNELWKPTGLVEFVLLFIWRCSHGIQYSHIWL